MYRVRYLEQTDKMSERVRLRMIEEVYSRELLEASVQQNIGLPNLDRLSFLRLVARGREAALARETCRQLRIRTLARVGRIGLPVGSLDVWRLLGYAGGLFVPLRDGTSGDSSYGGGRYLLDTAKGSWLGGDAVDSWFSGPLFNEPAGLSAANGKLYVADTNAHRIRVVDLKTNAVSTLVLKGVTPPFHNAAEEASAVQLSPVELQAGTWRVLQQGMRICEREGTARKLDPADTMKIACKTGTAPHGKTFQSWIAGYFPFDEPKYSFCLRAPAGTSQDRAGSETLS